MHETNEQGTDRILLGLESCGWTVFKNKSLTVLGAALSPNGRDIILFGANTYLNLGLMRLDIRGMALTDFLQRVSMYHAVQLNTAPASGRES
jgi:hypothetical protein